MKVMLLLVMMTIRMTVMTTEDFGRCKVNDIRKFSSPVSVVIPRITFGSPRNKTRIILGLLIFIIKFLITSPEEGRLVHTKYRETSSRTSLCYFVICLSDHLGVGIISRSIWGSLRGYYVSIQWLPTGFLQKIQ